MLQREQTIGSIEKESKERERQLLVKDLKKLDFSLERNLTISIKIIVELW